MKPENCDPVPALAPGEKMPSSPPGPSAQAILQQHANERPRGRKHEELTEDDFPLVPLLQPLLGHGRRQLVDEVEHVDVGGEAGAEEGGQQDEDDEVHVGGEPEEIRAEVRS